MAEESIDVFGMLVQWLYKGHVTLTEETPAQELDLYLGFLKLADKIDLLGRLLRLQKISRGFWFALSSGMATIVLKERDMPPNSNVF